MIVPTASFPLVTAAKLKAKWKFRTAIMMLFHILQKKNPKMCTFLAARVPVYSDANVSPIPKDHVWPQQRKAAIALWPCRICSYVL
jgi:hypothetical protein